MKTQFVIAFLICAFLATGTMDYDDQVRAAAERQTYPDRMPPVMRLQTDPIKPPRCPRFNAIGEPLLHAFAAQADGGEWTHSCTFGVRAETEFQRRKA